MDWCILHNKAGGGDASGMMPCSAIRTLMDRSLGQAGFVLHLTGSMLLDSLRMQAGVSKNILSRVQPAKFRITTDACPYVFADVPSQFDLTLLGATVGDPSWQSDATAKMYGVQTTGKEPLMAAISDSISAEFAIRCEKTHLELLTW
eukprot:1420552-Amphidinium_carterae.1